MVVKAARDARLNNTDHEKYVIGKRKNMRDLVESRKEIDEIDEQIVKLFQRRMDVCKDVATYKLQNGKPVLDRQRELDKIATLKTKAADNFYAHGVEELYEQIIELFMFMLPIMQKRQLC